MKVIRRISGVLFGMFVLAFGPLEVGAGVTPTNEWVDFYSFNTTFQGAPVPIGAVVDAYDPDGVHCGTFTVTNSGRYGFLHVYGDDPNTEEDEGAVPGDTITFRINGVPATPLGPDAPVWTSKGDRWQVDLSVGPPPSVSSVDPDTVRNNTDTSITVFGSDFVAPPTVSITADGDTVSLTDVVFVSSSRLTATVPAGLDAGVYDVVVVNPDGQRGILEDGLVVTVPPPQAEFSGSPTQGARPLTVQFIDQSTGAITGWLWDFGDNLTTSTERNPSHTYQDTGTYTVSLTVIGPGGSDTETKVNYIKVLEPPQAAFSGVPTQGARPLTVQFTDQSTGAITAWQWNFGDGSTSTERNPSHTYQNTGTYTVSLTVTGPGGSDTSTRYNYITVTPPPNRSPYFTSTPVTAGTEDSPYSYDADAVDPDGDPLTYSLTDRPDGMTIDASAGLITWSPDNRDVGQVDVTVKVADGNGGYAYQSYTITVANVPPRITSAPDTVAWTGSSYEYDLGSTDEGQGSVYSLVEGPEWLSLADPSAGLLRGTPGLEDVGKVTVTVRVDDGNGGTDEQSYSLNVIRPNVPPEITSVPDTSTSEDSLYIYDVEAVDQDGDTLVYRLIEAPGWMTIDPSNGIVSGTPTNADVGEVAVTVEVDDGWGGKDTQTYTLRVENAPPRITSSPPEEAVQDSLYTYDVRSTDEGQGLSLIHI